MTMGERTMRIACYGDSLTRGIPGVSFLRELEAMLPEATLLNYGKSGDTVVSLYRRLARPGADDGWDLAVLWVGVNDVLAKLSLGHLMLKRLMRQPPARDLVEFRDVYHRTLETLCRRADRVLAVSPLFVGEKLASPWNRELEGLCEGIASLSASFDAVQYVDLRACLSERLLEGCVSNYLPKRVAAIARDALFLRSPAQVDALSARRGLRLTLDGVHLNSEGAKNVAAVLARTIETLDPSGEALSRPSGILSSR
jgi:lysophospholipase L1-like esterase